MDLLLGFFDQIERVLVLFILSEIGDNGRQARHACHPALRVGHGVNDRIEPFEVYLSACLFADFDKILAQRHGVVGLVLIQEVIRLDIRDRAVLLRRLIGFADRGLHSSLLCLLHVFLLIVYRFAGFKFSREQLELFMEIPRCVAHILVVFVELILGQIVVFDNAPKVAVLNVIRPGNVDLLARFTVCFLVIRSKTRREKIGDSVHGCRTRLRDQLGEEVFIGLLIDDIIAQLRVISLRHLEQIQALIGCLRLRAAFLIVYDELVRGRIHGFCSARVGFFQIIVRLLIVLDLISAVHMKQLDVIQRFSFVLRELEAHENSVLACSRVQVHVGAGIALAFAEPLRILFLLRLKNLYVRDIIHLFRGKHLSKHLGRVFCR